MRISLATTVALFCGFSQVIHGNALPSFMSGWEDAHEAPDDDLNTRGNTRGRKAQPSVDETAQLGQHEDHRSLLFGLFSLFGPAPAPAPAPPAPAPKDATVPADVPSDPSVYPKYNPLQDAKCFNDAYDVPTMTDGVRMKLYEDYVKLFEWGFKNPSDSPVYAESSGLTSNRFAGMCLRMVFHDNTIDPYAYPNSAQSYVDENIQEGWWVGPSVMVTSGGDASVLICPFERHHKNNDYDQTASRVLHAFQSAGRFPRGPGISDDAGRSVNMMQKYKMSYADALHNCGLAAMTYLTENVSSKKRNDYPGQSPFPQSSAINEMNFGRLDACAVVKDPGQADSILEYNNRMALCGKSSLLPGVNLNMGEINAWFVDRGMRANVWTSLFGTHTLFDNFGSTSTLRNFGVPTHDYFKDYIGCPVVKVKDFVFDDVSSGCDWWPRCNIPTSDGVSFQKKSWPMVRSDCSHTEYYAGAKAVAKHFSPVEVKENDLFYQTEYYVKNEGSWVPDCVCALIHLGGGDNVDCVGPNAVDTKLSNSLFGSTYAQQPYPKDKLVPYAPKKGEARVVGHNSMDISVGSDGTLATVDNHNKLWISMLGRDWDDPVLGELVQIAVVGMNKYYSLDSNSKLYQWSSSKWNYIGHDLKAISAGSDGTVVGVSNLKVIWFKTGYNTNQNWGSMQGVNNAKDVAVVGGGILYYIVDDGGVWRTTNYANKGVQVGRRANKISAGSDGTVAVVSWDGTVWRKVRDDNNEAWVLVEEGLDRVDDIAVMNKGNVIVSGEASNNAIIMHIYLEDGTIQLQRSSASRRFSTSQVGHNALTISAGSDGTVATANGNRQFWKSRLGSGWTLGPGVVTDIAVVDNNIQYAIGSDTHVYRLQPGSSWVQVGHTSQCIAASWDNTVAVVSLNSGTIWFRTSTGAWTRTGDVTNALDVALVGGGTMYYIDTNGAIFRTTNYRNNGVQVGNNGSKISASRDGTVVMVDRAGNLWSKARDDNSGDWVLYEPISGFVDVAVVSADVVFVQDSGRFIYRVNF